MHHQTQQERDQERDQELDQRPTLRLSAWTDAPEVVELEPNDPILLVDGDRNEDSHIDDLDDIRDARRTTMPYDIDLGYDATD